VGCKTLTQSIKQVRSYDDITLTSVTHFSILSETCMSCLWAVWAHDQNYSVAHTKVKGTNVGEPA